MGELYLVDTQAKQFLERAGVPHVWTTIAPRHWKLLHKLFLERELTPWGELLELDTEGLEKREFHYLYEITRTGLIDRVSLRDPADRRRAIGYKYTVTPAMADVIRKALAILEEENAGNYFFEETEYKHAARLGRSYRQTCMLRRRLKDLLSGRTCPRQEEWPYWLRDLSAVELKGILGVREDRRWYGTALVPTEVDEEMGQAHRYDLVSQIRCFLQQEM